MFDLNKLISQSSNLVKEHEEKSKGNNFIKVAFLPEGMHTIKIIPDENMEFISEVVVHKPDKTYIKCKKVKWDDSNDVCPICKAIEAAEKNKISLSFNNYRTVLRKMYFYLQDTNKPSEFWQPGNLYCCIVNKKTTDAFINLIKLFESIPDENNKKLQFNVFNPNEDSEGITVTFSKGVSGSCNMAPNKYIMINKLDLSQYYKEGSEGLPSLDSIYVDNNYEPNDSEYMEQAKVIYNYILTKTNGNSNSVNQGNQQIQQNTQQIPNNNVNPGNLPSPPQTTGSELPQNQQTQIINNTQIPNNNVNPGNLPPPPQTTGSELPWE